MNKQGKYLKYWNFFNTSKRVIGVAYIKKGFNDKLHSHTVPEHYYLIWGKARFYLNKNVKFISAPSKEFIPKNNHHKLIPCSPFLILLYYFPIGPFSKITYKFYD